MIRRLRVIEGEVFDPYYNLAVEQRLLETVGEDECILYLWQNERTVVIGRNQNAWKECRVTRLQEAGGRLARRLSGGGAVYHDLGNLNYTFLMPTPAYDAEKQTRTVLTACRALGVPAELSGRNDLTAGGAKFSGSAFYHHRGRSYHHGTLLVDADLDRLGRYLRPSEAKLRAKGVDSVRARVTNLSALCPGLTVPDLRAALAGAFGEVYGLPTERMYADELDAGEVEAIRARNAGWEWNFGRELPCDAACEGRFPWGGVRIELEMKGGVVRRAAVWTDAMDWTLAETLEKAVTGCRLDTGALCGAVTGAGLPEGGDICRLLAELDL